jgi:DnaJ-domain-containing protein 1
MSEKGKYIYGIIQANGKRNFGALGLGDLLKEVYTVPFQDISAVVSDSPIKAYHSMTKDKVVGDLLRHQSVIEKVMENQTILPMKFGTFVEGEKEVTQMMKMGYEQFRQALNSINNKIELDVVAFWNKDMIFKELAEEKEIKEFKEKIISIPAGPQLDDRISLGRLVETSLKKKNRGYTEEIRYALEEKAEDFCTHDTLDDMMILNCSFLLEAEREKDFDEKLNELDERYQKRINFRCVGPLPPYSFCTVEVKRIGFDTIDQARKLLGLGEEITPSEIKSAHRKLVFKYHPDKNPQEESSNKEFNELNRAYKLLLEYCRSDRCSLRKEDVKDSFLINILKVAETPERKGY